MLKGNWMRSWGVRPQLGPAYREALAWTQKRSAI